VKSVHEVRTEITYWWFISTVPAILIVIAQTALGVFGNTLGDLFKGGLGWILPLWTPVTTLILVPLSVTMDQSGGTKEFKNKFMHCSVVLRRLSVSRHPVGSDINDNQDGRFIFVVFVDVFTNAGSANCIDNKSVF